MLGVTQAWSNFGDAGFNGVNGFKVRIRRAIYLGIGILYRSPKLNTS